MWENLSGFNQEKKFNSWLYAIARNTAFDWLRKKKALPFAAFENTEGYNLLEEIIDEKGFDYRQFIIEMDMRLEMEGILSKLPITAQSILLLHHKHGFSLVEIAKILGQSSNTVKSKYRRVILFLRQEIATKDLKREDQKFEFAPKRIPAA